MSIFFKKFSESLNLFDILYYFSYQYFTTNILNLLSKIYSCNMKRRADIDIDQAMAQMDLASSGSSSESSLADSSDLSSPSKDDSEGSSSLDALGQPATSSTSTQGNIGFTWTNQDNIPYIHSFSGTPGIKANLSSILDIFQAFIPNDMIDLIADKTNRYAASKPSKHDPFKRRHDIEWKDVSSAEIKVFFGLCILMGVVQKLVIKLHWSAKAMLTTPFYLEVMLRDRFLQILSNMHFANNADNDGSDKLFKIRQVMEAIISNFRKTFTPYENIATDESLLKFHGRLGF